MTNFARFLFAFATALGAGSAAAVEGATAPYNEAVRIVDGKRVVEVAPFPASMKSLLKILKRPDEIDTSSQTLNVIETPMGLMDCNHVPFYDAKICSPSSFGKVKRFRQWMVKLDGHWQLCVGRLKPIKCIPTVQDGVLRALPTPEME